MLSSSSFSFCGFFLSKRSFISLFVLPPYTFLHAFFFPSRGGKEAAWWLLALGNSHTVKIRWMASQLDDSFLSEAEDAPTDSHTASVATERSEASMPVGLAQSASNGSLRDEVMECGKKRCCLCDDTGPTQPRGLARCSSHIGDPKLAGNAMDRSVRAAVQSQPPSFALYY